MPQQKPLRCLAICCVVLATLNSLRASAQENLTIAEEKRITALENVQDEILRTFVTIFEVERNTLVASEIPNNIENRYNFIFRPSAFGTGLTFFLAMTLRVYDYFEPRLAAASSRQPRIVIPTAINPVVIGSRIIDGRMNHASIRSFATVSTPLLVVGTLGLGTVLMASAFQDMRDQCLFNNATQECIIEQQVIRDILGHDEALETVAAESARRMTRIFQLDPRVEQNFKEVLKNEILQEGIRTQFNPEAIQIDMFELLLRILPEYEEQNVIALRVLTLASSVNQPLCSSEELEELQSSINQAIVEKLATSESEHSKVDVLSLIKIDQNANTAMKATVAACFNSIYNNELYADHLAFDVESLGTTTRGAFSDAIQTLQTLSSVLELMQAQDELNPSQRRKVANALRHIQVTVRESRKLMGD